MAKSKCCNAEMNEAEYMDDLFAVCFECQKLYKNGELFKFKPPTENQIHNIKHMGKIAFSQPSKEEEKHKLCSDYQKACNKCYQEFKDWQKSDESKSWEEKRRELNETMIELIGLKAYPLIRTIDDLVISAIEEERVKERLRNHTILHEYAMKTKDTKTLDLLEEIQQKILNPNN